MIRKLHEKLCRGETTSRKLTEAALAHLEARNGETHAFLTICADGALSMADEADRRIARGDVPLLCGIPMALKDNICTAGIRTTCASEMLEDFVPPYSAFVWRRLQEQGAVLLGKTNMDEFAMGAGGETSFFGVCRNPRNPEYVAGGSSGGSAAAVADGTAVYALGSDTGGSVRVPASFCGVVGVKPTYGRVSRQGLVSFASSLDQIGILARSVQDTADVLSAIAGADAGDMTTAAAPMDLDSIDAGGRVDGMRVGVPGTEFLQAAGATEAVCAAVTEAARLLAGRGAVLVEPPWPDPEIAYDAYYMIAACEASSNLARYDGIRYGKSAGDVPHITGQFTGARRYFGPEVQRRLLVGTAALSARDRGIAYDSARQVREQIRRQMARSLEACDVILTPAAPGTAYAVGAHAGQAMAGRGVDVFAVAPSLAGLPALSLPVGEDGGMPMGVQLVSAAFREDRMYTAALALEEALRNDG